MTTQTIHEQIDKIVEHPTIDGFLDKHPRKLNFPDDYKALIEVLRRDRARFIQSEAEKKAKKEGIEE